MENRIAKFSIPYNRILYGADSFILETDTASYRLRTGIGEHYIMLNLAGGCKKDGVMVVEQAEKKGKAVLLPVAVKNGENVTWIATSPDGSTEWPQPADLSLFDHLKADTGEEYPDGFIDWSRTTLTYNELVDLEKTLHETNYVEELYRQHIRRHPNVPVYDPRLHYPMIKGIRKHRHYTDDFVLPCDEFTFYIGWRDPFPWYLYTATFGGVNTWPSHAKMRLMADNRCLPGIPIALKVLKNKKANDRIRHYALVLAGMDPANDRLVIPCKERHPRAVARVLYERGAPELYPMLLDNARGILAGVNDDILDDYPVIHSRYYDKMEEYTVNHRGFIRLDTLGEEQVRELWELYRQVAQQIADTKNGDERLRLGNAFRAFLLALIYNGTQAVPDILEDIYRNFNFLLYSEWSQDSKFKWMDTMWRNYLYQLVVQWDILDNFWQWLQHHAKGYDHYYLYTNQHFFLTIYSKVAYHVLSPELFYDALAPLIDSNYVLVEVIWAGVTGDEPLGEEDPPLDHRWYGMFCEYNYYTWTSKARFYHSLVNHRISPPPPGWNGKWEPEKKKLGIIIPR